NCFTCTLPRTPRRQKVVCVMTTLQLGSHGHCRRPTFLLVTQGTPVSRTTSPGSAYEMPSLRDVARPYFPGSRFRSPVQRLPDGGRFIAPRTLLSVEGEGVSQVLAGADGRLCRCRRSLQRRLCLL